MAVEPLILRIRTREVADALAAMIDQRFAAPSEDSLVTRAGDVPTVVSVRVVGRIDGAFGDAYGLVVETPWPNAVALYCEGFIAGWLNACQPDVNPYAPPDLDGGSGAPDGFGG